MKPLTLLLLILLTCCSYTEQVSQICYSVYEFPVCVRNVTIADNDPQVCDDIQIRLYQDSTNYILHEDYHIQDSTIFIDNLNNIEYIYGKLYLIYYD